MKTLALLILGTFFTVGNLFATVEVVFENPEEYRDIDYGDHQTKRGIKIHLPRLEQHILKLGKRYLKDGQTLTMNVTDIDLAGDYEPWRSPDFDDIRIVKSIYPPRISFSYEFKDSEGNILKSGEEKLVDLAFDFRVRISSYDDLFYDKEMITDWMRKITKDLD
ncbi:MAG: DUF3016 domain-containing protein [Verrucomicrobia bacterium]|nr:DUF3016 domain-containing protein [Verrucomicrobiota bacterium]